MHLQRRRRSAHGDADGHSSSRLCGFYRKTQLDRCINLVFTRTLAGPDGFLDGKRHG
jgi:hypothetical protein